MSSLCPQCVAQGLAQSEQLMFPERLRTQMSMVTKFDSCFRSKLKTQSHQGAKWEVQWEGSSLFLFGHDTSWDSASPSPE